MSGKSAARSSPSAGWDSGEPAITFKAGEMSYALLAEQPGLRPAPYLASRGLKWTQQYGKPRPD